MQDFLSHVTDQYEGRVKQKNLAEEELQRLKIELATLRSISTIQERALKELHIAYQQVSAEIEDYRRITSELKAKAEATVKEKLLIQ